MLSFRNMRIITMVILLIEMMPIRSMDDDWRRSRPNEGTHLRIHCIELLTRRTTPPPFILTFIPNSEALELVQAAQVSDRIPNSDPLISLFIQIWHDYKCHPDAESFFKKTIPIELVSNVSFIQAFLLLEENGQHHAEICSEIFFVAARLNETNTLQFFIDNKYEVDQRDCISRTAIYEAIDHGALDAIKLLIRWGASLRNLRNIWGDPLAYALSIGQEAAASIIRDALAERDHCQSMSRAQPGAHRELGYGLSDFGSLGL